jgi:hypothetical protein
MAAGKIGSLSRHPTSDGVHFDRRLVSTFDDTRKSGMTRTTYQVVPDGSGKFALKRTTYYGFLGRSEEFCIASKGKLTWIERNSEWFNLAWMDLEEAERLMRRYMA